MKHMRKDKPRVKKLEKDKLVKGYCLMKGATLGEGNGSDEEDHGRDEGEHEKGESRR